MFEELWAKSSRGVRPREKAGDIIPFLSHGFAAEREPPSSSPSGRMVPAEGIVLRVGDWSREKTAEVRGTRGTGGGFLVKRVGGGRRRKRGRNCGRSRLPPPRAAYLIIVPKTFHVKHWPTCRASAERVGARAHKGSCQLPVCWCVRHPHPCPDPVGPTQRGPVGEGKMRGLCGLSGSRLATLTIQRLPDYRAVSSATRATQRRPGFRAVGLRPSPDLPALARH
jgi:hypothetical protein